MLPTTDTADTQLSLLGTGLNGLVGSKLVTDFPQPATWVNLDVSDPVQPVDITNLDSIKAMLAAHPQATSLVHCAAFTDVTKAWEQNGDKSGIAYQVNVTGTKNIAQACREAGISLIHISTAFVFSGDKEGLYTESDPMKPIEWYGQTKAWAEEVVMESGADWTILRIDFPFRSDPFVKPDIIRKTVAALEKGYPLFSNHWFGPTYIDDFVKVIEWVIRTKASGLYHASSGEKWSDFELGKLINESHKLGLEVKEGDLAEYQATLQRPYQRNTAMDSTKLQAALDFKLTPIRQAVPAVQL